MFLRTAVLIVLTLPFSHAQSLQLVNAASYSNLSFAPQSIAAAYGTKLATSQAQGTDPLPFQLAGTKVTVAGIAAPLYFVSSGQVNFVVPAGVPIGDAPVVVTSGDASSSKTTITIAAVAPALFTANADGKGPAAGNLLRINSKGERTVELIAKYDAAQKLFVPADIDMKADQLYLLLYGTGIRNARSVQVKIGTVIITPDYAGPQGTYSGLDQINVAIPRSLGSAGNVDVILTADGKAANTVKLSFNASVTIPILIGGE